jgi:LysR family transcriptional regulator for metE and metH
MAGLGVAFISAHTVAAEVSAGWLSVLPVEGLPVVREWFAVRSKGRQPSPASAAMWEFVAGKGAGFLPDVSAMMTGPRRARMK